MPSICTDELYIKEFSRATLSRSGQRYIPMDYPRRDDAFLLTLSGSCRFTLHDGRCFTAQPGELMYLARGTDYALEILTDSYHYIPCTFLFDTREPCQSLLIHPREPAVLEGLFRKLAKTYEVTGPGQKQLCIALLYRICAYILQNEAGQYLPGSSAQKLEAARTYIQSHITDQNLHVALLLENAGMSEVHFRKLFSRQYQLTPSAYIRHQRVRYAAGLMAEKELRLEEVAEQSGFSSLAHMCKVFKAITGTTPGAYRTNQQKT